MSELAKVKRKSSSSPSWRVRASLFEIFLYFCFIFGFLLFVVGETKGLGFLELRNGYFYDPETQQPWLSHGIAYQSWLADLGEWQTDEQIEYDIREMRKAGANSLRVDFVWKHIEEAGDEQYVWDRYDYLIAMATKYEMRLFVLIGYQWPPNWFPGTPFEEEKVGEILDPGWYTMHPPGPEPKPPFVAYEKFYNRTWTSDIIGFETPAARAQYVQWLATVGGRYKDESAIAGWIIGNEFGYIGLWSYRQDGYDPYCQAAWRRWLANHYNDSLALLNNNWNTQLTSFEDAEMPLGYNRLNPIWADVVQWREDSIAGFLAEGAVAIRAADPNHMLSYSTVGMIWGTEDWRYHAEDTRKIAAACKAVGAPLAFMSINNYPTAMTGNELRTGKWGFTYGVWNTGLPVLLSETGFTSTENLFPVSVDAGILLRSALWEGLLAGAIGVHVFTWQDRPWLTVREKGFGIVNENREPYLAFKETKAFFQTVAQMKVKDLLPKSRGALPDVGFYWTSAQDQIYNRYQENMQTIWGPLERMGFEPRFITSEELRAGAFRDLKMLILPRSARLDEGDLQYILDNVITAGVHVYADADLPGQANYYLKNLTDWVPMMDQLFGIAPVRLDVFQDTVTEYEYGIQYTLAFLKCVAAGGCGATPTGTEDTLWTWKYNYINVTSAEVVAAFQATMDWASGLHPAVAVKDHGTAKAIISAVSLGAILPSIQGPGALPDNGPWDLHSRWFSSLFLSSTYGFNVLPYIRVEGSHYVMADYRNLSDSNSYLITVNNWSDTYENITLTVPFVGGYFIRELLSFTTIESSSTGVWNFKLTPNQAMVLLARLVSSKPEVILDLPRGEVTPRQAPYQFSISFDAAGLTDPTIELKLVSSEGTILASTIAQVNSEVGSLDMWIAVPESDTTNNFYPSSDDGGVYYIVAELFQVESGGRTAKANSSVPMLISFAVKPAAPFPLVPETVQVPLPVSSSWEHIYPLSRTQTFFPRVGVYYSNKTQQMDWAHGQKVGSVMGWLESMGYLQNYLGPFGEVAKRMGKLFYAISDVMTCEYSLCGGDFNDGELMNLNANYTSTYFRVLILPGTWVMSDEEIDNVKAWMRRTPDAILIATEAVGMYDENGKKRSGRMEEIFGFPSSAKIKSIDSSEITLKVLDTTHPATRHFSNPTLRSALEGLATVGSKYWTSEPTSSNAQTLGKLTVGKESYPAIVTNPYGRGRALVLNADFMPNNQYASLVSQLMWGIGDWMMLVNTISKLRWELLCSSSTTTETPIAFGEIWLTTHTDNGTVWVNPVGTQTPSSCNYLTWRGFVYPWNSTNPWEDRVGTYTSPATLAPLPIISDVTPPVVKSPEGRNEGVLEVKDGYLYDPLLEERFIPRGFVYHLSSGAGKDYTSQQLNFDLREMKRMFANSIRVYVPFPSTRAAYLKGDFGSFDSLVKIAKKAGIRVFVQVGSQRLPKWVDSDLNADRVSPYTGEKSTSRLINFSSKKARLFYTQMVSNLVSQYVNDSTIAAWSVGENFVFYDKDGGEDSLIEPSMIGYDSVSLQSYQSYLSQRYVDISVLNQAWNTSYYDFVEVQMPTKYPKKSERQTSGLSDLFVWRRRELADFIAEVVQGVKLSDPTHLVTYTVGSVGPSSVFDTSMSSEDIGSIAGSCQTLETPLDFITLNNFPAMNLGSDARSLAFGIERTRFLTRSTPLPILIGATGVSETNMLQSDSVYRAGEVMDSLVWEGLGSGAIGVYVYHWNDRERPNPLFEKTWSGFGVFTSDRTPKEPHYRNLFKAFRKLDELDISRVLLGSNNIVAPREAKVAVIYSQLDSDQERNRVDSEVAGLWTAFNRLGIAPVMISENELALQSPSWFRENFAAIFLPYNAMMSTENLMALQPIVDTGVHIHGGAGLPGGLTPAFTPQDTNVWYPVLESLFGVRANSTFHPSPYPAFDGRARSAKDKLGDDSSFTYLNSAYASTNFTFLFPTLNWNRLRNGTQWNFFEPRRVWGEVLGVNGTSVLYNVPVDSEGVMTDDERQLSFQIKDGVGRGGKSALTLFSIGDVLGSSAAIWDYRRSILEGVYITQFELKPLWTIYGENSNYVSVTLREGLIPGSLILLMQNLSPYPSEFTLSSSLFLGRKVQSLRDGTMHPVEGQRLSTDLGADEANIFYLYTTTGVSDASAISPSLAKISIASSPVRMWMSEDQEYEVKINYDTANIPLKVVVWLTSVDSTGGELKSLPRFITKNEYEKSVQGVGTVKENLRLSDFEFSIEDFKTSAKGGRFLIRARLESSESVVLAETAVRAAVLWSIRPRAQKSSELPSAPPVRFEENEPTYFHHYYITLTWEELPGFANGDFPYGQIRRHSLFSFDYQDVYTVTLKLLDEKGRVVGKLITGLIGDEDEEHEYAVPLWNLNQDEDLPRELQSSPYRIFATLTAGPPNLDRKEDFEDEQLFKSNIMLNWKDRDAGGQLCAIQPFVDFTYSSYNDSFQVVAGLTDEHEDTTSLFIKVYNDPVDPLALTGFIYPLPYPVSLISSSKFEFDFQLLDLERFEGTVGKVGVELVDQWDNVVSSYQRISTGRDQKDKQKKKDNSEDSTWIHFEASADDMQDNKGNKVGSGFHYVKIAIALKMEENGTYYAMFDHVNIRKITDRKNWGITLGAFTVGDVPVTARSSPWRGSKKYQNCGESEEEEWTEPITIPVPDGVEIHQFWLANYILIAFGLACLVTPIAAVVAHSFIKRFRRHSENQGILLGGH